MIQLLTTISQQINSSNSGVIPSPAETSFHPTSSSVRVNAYWFISLAFSLVCALTATLVKQWGRSYLQETSRLPAAYKRARVRSYLFEGLEKYKVTAVVSAVPTLLHTSLLLFFTGLVEFLYPIHKSTAFILVVVFAVGSLIYFSMTLRPLFDLQCPFQTPVTHFGLYSWPILFNVTLAPIFWLFDRILHGLERGLRLPYQYRMWKFFHYSPHKSDFLENRVKAAMKETDQRVDRDDHALHWLVEQLNENHELEPLIKGLPGFVKSSKVQDGHAHLIKLCRNGFESRVLALIEDGLNSSINHHSQKHIGRLVSLSVDFLSIMINSSVMNNRHLYVQITTSLSWIRKVEKYVEYPDPIGAHARHISLMATYRLLYRICDDRDIPSHININEIFACSGIFLPLATVSTGMVPRQKETLIVAHIQDLCDLVLIQAIANTKDSDVASLPYQNMRQMLLYTWLSHTRPKVHSYEMPEHLNSLRTSLLQAAVSSDIGNINIDLRDLGMRLCDTLEHPTWQCMARNIMAGKPPNNNVPAINLQASPWNGAEFRTYQTRASSYSTVGV